MNTKEIRALWRGVVVHRSAADNVAKDIVNMADKLVLEYIERFDPAYNKSMNANNVRLPWEIETKTHSREEIATIYKSPVLPAEPEDYVSAIYIKEYVDEKFNKIRKKAEQILKNRIYAPVDQEYHLLNDIVTITKPYKK